MKSDWAPNATSQVLPQNIRGHWSEVVDSIDCKLNKVINHAWIP